MGLAGYGPVPEPGYYFKIYAIEMEGKWNRTVAGDRAARRRGGGFRRQRGGHDASGECPGATRATFYAPVVGKNAPESALVDRSAILSIQAESTHRKLAVGGVKVSWLVR